MWNLRDIYSAEISDKCECYLTWVMVWFFCPSRSCWDYTSSYPNISFTNYNESDNNSFVIFLIHHSHRHQGECKSCQCIHHHRDKRGDNVNKIQSLRHAWGRDHPSSMWVFFIRDTPFSGSTDVSRYSYTSQYGGKINVICLRLFRTD